MSIATRHPTACTCLLALGILLAPGLAQAQSEGADEARRQSMMNDMRSEAARNDQIEANRNSTSSYSSGSSGSSGSSSSSGGSSGSAYQPYVYKPEGPHSVVATYEFTVYKQETEAQTIARITAEAQGGNAQSQYDLGRIYYTGYGATPLDTDEARHWFCEAAKQDHPPAKSQCAAMMYNAQGGPEDKQPALAYVKDAATKGDPYGEALYAYWYMLERVHSNGAYDAPPAAVIAMAEDAADRGQLVAQVFLGDVIYETGLGLAPDRVKAIKYLRLAIAQTKRPDLANLLGRMLVSGNNETDVAEGLDLLHFAADAGRADALGNLAQYASFTKQDYDTAFSYATKSAQQGDARGEYVLAQLYYFGHGTPQDVATAMKWFRAAADLGMGGASGIVAAYAMNTRDYDTAFKYATKSVQDENDPQGESVLGQLYYFGQGTDKNLEMALKWLRLAASGGDDQAQVMLGKLYYFGTEVPKDLKESARWFKMAAAQGDTEAVEAMKQSDLSDVAKSH